MPNTLNLGDYIGLLIQVPIVGIFIYFTLKLVGIFMDAFNKFSATLQQRDQQWEEMLNHRDEQWQRFLAEQRDANNNAVITLGGELRSLTQEMAQLKGVMLAHDERARERLRRSE